MAKTVVVLGGSLGGLAVAHRLLKHTLPREPDLRVVLVSKNSHFYWSLASLRAVVPGLIDDADVLQPIWPGLRQYSSGSVEFIVRAATRVDVAAKTVHMAVAADDDDDDNDNDDDAKDGPGRRRRQRRVVAYDHLVVATGAYAANAAIPWKAAGSHAACLAAVAADAHVVAGGGYTGVEVAAEIKDAFPAKTVVLVNAGLRLIAGDALAAAVERELVLLGVDVRNNVRVSVSAPPPPALRPRPRPRRRPVRRQPAPAHRPLPPHHRPRPQRPLPVRPPADPRRLRRRRLQAARRLPHHRRPGRRRRRQHRPGVPRKGPLRRQGPPVEVFLCSIGRRHGSGRVGPIPVPSFLWAIKGRTLGTERTAKYANGTMW